MEALQIKPNDKILILAPHADDESIGCGGLISLYAKQIDVILLTDGRFGGTDNPETIAKIRHKEFEDNMKKAGVNQYQCLNIHDRNLKNCFNIFSKIQFDKYTHIFIPHEREQQRDHKIVFPFILKSRINKNTIIAGYEVWTPIEYPNFYLNISEHIKTKKALMNTYRSQLKFNDYTAAAVGLNRYRGLQTGVLYGECFYIKYFGELKIQHSFIRRLFNVQKRINRKVSYYFLGLHFNKK